MYTDYYESPLGPLAIEADNTLILSIRFLENTFLNTAPNVLTKRCKEQLTEYFAGNRKTFDIPLYFSGTDFQNAVWRQLTKIEYGSTCSYGDVAYAIGHPRAYRAVGSANRMNSFPIIIPCHRVIAHDRSLAGYAGGMDKKIWLLKHEGVL